MLSCSLGLPQPGSRADLGDQKGGWASQQCGDPEDNRSHLLLPLRGGAAILGSSPAPPHVRLPSQDPWRLLLGPGADRAAAAGVHEGCDQERRGPQTANQHQQRSRSAVAPLRSRQRLSGG